MDARSPLIDALEHELLDQKVRLENMVLYDLRHINDEFARQKLIETAQQAKTLLSFVRALRSDPILRQVKLSDVDATSDRYSMLQGFSNYPDVA